MTALGDWLRQIVLVVVLAALADMLLPTKAMQKYVRTVMGLAIIAMMLQPILPFFQKDWANHVTELAETEVFNGTTGAGTAPVPDVSRLKLDMHAQEDAEANASVATQLTDGIGRQFQCEVQDIQVSGVVEGPLATRVSIRLSSLDMIQRTDIQAWVAKQLGIDKDQVVVTSNVGG